VKILARGRHRHPAHAQVAVRDLQLIDCGRLSRVDAGEGDQLLRVALTVVRDEAVGDLGPQVTAFEREDEALIDLARLSPVVIRVGRRDRAPHGSSARCRAGARRAGRLAEVQLPELIGRLPDVRMTIYNQVSIQ
jgi:hypothetical protein